MVIPMIRLVIVSLTLWLLSVGGVVLALTVKLALDKEYEYWAPRVAAAVIHLSARLLPRKTRALRRDEWLAELDLLTKEGLHGFLFAIRNFTRVPLTLVRDRGIPAETGPTAQAATLMHRSSGPPSFEGYIVVGDERKIPVKLAEDGTLQGILRDGTIIRIAPNNPSTEGGPSGSSPPSRPHD